MPEIKKAFILAGGQGTRLSEHTKDTPKPLVPIGQDAVVVSVMRNFYKRGVRDFYLLCGYRVGDFKTYFRDYMLNGNNMCYTRWGAQPLDNSSLVEDWNVNIIDTGEHATTGQRVHAIRRYLEPGESFFLTYGDSVSDVDVREVERVLEADPTSVLAVTVVNKTERFGIILPEGDSKVKSFAEKTENVAPLINGGYMACSSEVLDYVSSTTEDFSYKILTKLAALGKMSYHHHRGFWHAMDTKRDLDELVRIHSENPELF